MEVRLGKFKYLFILDSVYGNSTVSLSTLEQCKWKIAYSVALLGCYVAESVIYICRGNVSNEPDPIFMLISRIIALIWPIHSLIMAIVDHKSKISIALNLEAIESRLKNENIPVTGEDKIKAMIWGLLAINVFGQLWGFTTIVLGSQNQLPITKFVTTFQIIGTQLHQGFSPVIFLAKFLMIERAIMNGLCEINRKVNDPSTARSQGKRSAKIQADAERKWALLSELRGSLYNVEATIRESSWMQIISNRLMVEIFGPLYLVTIVKLRLLALKGDPLLRVIFPFLSTIYIVEKMYKVKGEALESLSEEIGKDGALGRKLIKHQILAGIHRNRAHFSCGLFDIDYSLLIAVLENVLLIATSMIGNS